MVWLALCEQHTVSPPPGILLSLASEDHIPLGGVTVYLTPCHAFDGDRKHGGFVPHREPAHGLLGVGAIAQHALPALGRSLQVGSPHSTCGHLRTCTGSSVWGRWSCLRKPCTLSPRCSSKANLLQVPFRRWWKKVEEQGSLESFGKGALRQAYAGVAPAWVCGCPPWAPAWAGRCGTGGPEQQARMAGGRPGGHRATPGSAEWHTAPPNCQTGHLGRWSRFLGEK